MRNFGGARMVAISLGLLFASLPSPAASQTTLACGVPVTSSIILVDEIDSYLLLGVGPGDRITLRMKETATFALSEVLELHDGSGTRIGMSSLASDGATLTMTLTTVGPYTLLARDASNRQTGAYRLLLQRLNNPCSATVLSCGQTVATNLATVGQIDSYQLSVAGQGDRITLRMKETGTIALSEVLELHDGSGALIGTSSFASDGATLTATLATAGPYTLLARDSSNSQAGGYRLLLQRLNNPCNATTLSCGQTAATNLATVGQIDSYQLSVVGPGDRITLRMKETGTFALSEVLELHDGNGTLIGTSSLASDGATLTATLATAGPYTLLARDSSNSQAGGYRLLLQRLNNPCSATVLSCGQTVATNLATVGQIDSYQLSVVGPGDRITLRMKETGTIALSEALELHDGNGTLIGTSSLASDGATLTATLATAGPYTLLARDSSNSQAGGYRLLLQRLNNPCEAIWLSCRRSLAGGLGAAGEIDTYRVQGVAPGDAITLRMKEVGTIFLSELLELYDGRGALLGTSTLSSDGATLTATLTTAGPYTLLARDSSNTQTGGYQLTFVRENGACPAFTFTDDPITAGVTVMKAAHLSELRQAVDSLRLSCGLGAFAYTDPTLTPGITPIKAVHIIELRTALVEFYDCKSLPLPSFSDATLLAGSTVIGHLHLEDIRKAIRAVE
jgi:hypothetical protein